MTEALLKATLAVAVPMWTERLQRYPWAALVERAQICAQHVAEHGDIIQFKSKGTAEAFNRLAEGLTIASFMPGGVKFLGIHWQNSHPEANWRAGKPSEEQRALQAATAAIQAFFAGYESVEPSR